MLKLSYFKKEKIKNYYFLPNNLGFTLVELLIVISIIGLITASAVYSFSLVRMQSRDTMRAASAAELSRALALYINEQGSYPVSNGECLHAGDPGVGYTLKARNVIINVPLDKSWPTAVPTSISNGYAVPNSKNFCFYYSSTGSTYYLSYYLESNSKAGSAGIHVATPAGTQ